MSETEKIRVLVVDDSKVARWALTSALNRDSEIEVVGQASDAFEASDKIEQLNPDVMTLDLMMPKMDGLTFLNGLMHLHPVPVVVCSAYSPKGGAIAIEAFSLGAIDIVPKPNHADDWNLLSRELIKKVKAASKVQISAMRQQVVHTHHAKPPPEVYVLNPPEVQSGEQPIIAIGASTGGTVAIERVLRSLPANVPPILVVQHMPEGFTHAYAKRLNSVCSFEVKEAIQGMKLRHGLAIVAQGSKHMTLSKSVGDGYSVNVEDGPKVHHQRPAVDVLFDSIVKYCAAPCIGLIMTGMGSDGAQGLLKLRKWGARTVVQSIQSSVATGMPQSAIQLDAAEVVTDLDHIAHTIMQWIE